MQQTPPWNRFGLPLAKRSDPVMENQQIALSNTFNIRSIYAANGVKTR